MPNADPAGTSAALAAANQPNGGGAAANSTAAAGASAPGNLASQLTVAAAPASMPVGSPNQLTLTLHTDALGAVAVQATMRPQGLEAAIQAVRAETRTAMQQNLPLLQQTLADHNIRLANLMVARGPVNATGPAPQAQGNGQQGFSQPGGGRGQGGGGRQAAAGFSRPAPAHQAQAPANSPGVNGATPARLTPGQLNIRV